MSRAHSAPALSAAFAARYPQSNVLESLSASADKGTLSAVQAQAVRGFSTVTGKLQWVKATENFYEAGELIKAGDFVEMRELDANAVISRNFAVASTAEEAAQAASAADAKGGK